IGAPPLEEVHVPKEFANTGMFDYFINVACEIAEEDLEGRPYTLDTVKWIFRREFKYLKEAPPGPEQFTEVAKAALKLGTQMAQLSRDGLDTIWGWIAKNFYRPELFRRHFDLVVGNPPWLSFRYVGNLKYKQ